MRTFFKIVVVLLVVAIGLAAVGVGYVYVRKSQWRQSGGVVVRADDWVQYRLLTPAVIRDMPTPGLTGQPTHFYFCESGAIEINHVHFQTTLPRDEVMRELEPFFLQCGFTKSGPNFARGDEQLNIAYEKQAGETWVKLFLTRK